MTNVNVLVVIIHNNEEQIPAKLVVENLVRGMPDVSVLEVHEQGSLSTDINWSILKDHMKNQFRLEDEWREYRGAQSLKRRLLAGGNLIYKLSFLLTSRKKRREEWKIKQIEHAVTLKHQNAWKQFSASTATTLLVLETDAIWIKDESEALTKFLSAIDVSKPTYISLAGGLDIELLGIDSLIINRPNLSPDNSLLFSRPVTNTNCAYAMNQPMVKLLLKHLESHPGTESLGIGWFINSAFIETVSKGTEVICLHAWPPVLLHGSMNGVTKSWHPNRI